ncbi:MAG: DUF523 domain-containing protein [Thermodesulfobacteriota bacterium]
MTSTAPILVCACLVGEKVRYDGRDATSKKLLNELGNLPYIAICPELLGGLTTPRPRAEITDGDGADVLNGKAEVRTEHGSLVTSAYIKGAEEVVRIAKDGGVQKAYLKEKSPSCGVKSLSKAGKKVPGIGVTAELLRREGITLKGF